MNVLLLRRNRCNVRLLQSSFLLGSRTRISAAGAVVAYPIDVGIVVDHRRVVNVVNYIHVYVIHRAVVIEMVMIPAAALIPSTEISEAIPTVYF